MTRSSRVEGGASWDLMWITHWRRSALGHNSGSSDALCPTPPPDAVLLGRELQHDKICDLEVAFSGCGRKDAAAAAEGGVFDAEQCAI